MKNDKETELVLTKGLTAILVPAGLPATLTQEHSSAVAMLDLLRAFPCATPSDETDLAEFLGAIKGKAKELEAQRKSVTGPLASAKAAVDALFKPSLGVLAEAEAIIKDKLAEADQRRKAQNRAALDQAAASAGMGDTKAAASALASVQATTAPAGVSFREEWTVAEYTLEAIPREWLTVDWSKVKLYCKEWVNSQTIPPVPGLVFARKSNVIGRAT